MDKFDEMMKDAVTNLGILAERPVANDAESVCSALAHVFHHGSFNDGAKAVMIVSQFMWAHCEKSYHSSEEKK
jgi:hypothetical protein